MNASIVQTRLEKVLGYLERDSGNFFLLSEASDLRASNKMNKRLSYDLAGNFHCEAIWHGNWLTMSYGK
jgi:hypothetical protein